MNLIIDIQSVPSGRVSFVGTIGSLQNTKKCFLSGTYEVVVISCLWFSRNLSEVTIIFVSWSLLPDQLIHVVSIFGEYNQLHS